MGHQTDRDRTYRLLETRLDRHVTGAPPSPVLREILRRLFSPQDAEIAWRLPSRPTPANRLARRLGMPLEELVARLDGLAHRGLVVDLEYRGVRYYCLPPVVVGFYEFTFMRARDDISQKELARLFDQYMNREDFARRVFQGPTHIGRALVREEALPGETYSEVLDWERATRLIETAWRLGVSLCACRHQAWHLGRACDQPQRCCLSLNWAADYLIRNGHAQPLRAGEALEILERCKQSGLAQTADNVQRQVTYICNCCRCCCGLMRAWRHFEARGAIVSSNWIVSIDTAACQGCGRCVGVCPVGAIHLSPPDAEGKRRAVCNTSVCLGCGVCAAHCPAGAAVMRRRAQRVYCPATIFDRVARMALERGKLAELVFDDPQRLSHRALRRVFRHLEHSPLAQRILAARSLRSAFLRCLSAGAKTATGRLREIFE